MGRKPSIKDILIIMRNPIKYLVMFLRIRGYISIIQFLMIGYLFIVSTDFNLYLTVFLVAVLSLAIGIIDYKFIFPREQETISMKNPVFMEILKRVKEIEKKCDVNGIHFREIS